MSPEPRKQHITVNGEQEQVPIGATLEDLLEYENLATYFAPSVAVAVNDEVVPREQWKDVVIEEDDRIEVVSASQGG